MSRRSKGIKIGVRSAVPVSRVNETPGGTNSRSPLSECRSTSLPDRWMVPGVCIFLAAITFVVFGQTLRYEFINFDDDVYVYDNAQICQRLSLSGIEWAFGHSVEFNWHPLTMLSYMLDYQLYGLKAGGYHFTNVLLHGAAAILLFLVLRKMTAALWRSAFVAALFAIHPLRVESVAWVAERKDVLSGVFFMLSLGAYVWYVRDPRRWFRYLAVVFFFALGLMSKPILVTLPFVLLLLDYWPLNRFSATGNGPKLTYVASRLILEKIPLFALAAAVCLVTFVTQEKIIAPLPFSLRASNASVSCATYLWQMVYPRNLAAYYPLKEQGLPLWEVVLSLLVLVLISALAFRWRRRRPWLLVGWLWYLGMLVPVIGLVSSGLRAHADRYTYLPQIGLYLIIAWAATGLVAGRRHGRLLVGGLAFAVVVALILCARSQVSYWRNSELLWTHTLACTSANVIAHNNLGNALFQKGNVDEAFVHYQKALQINPDYAEAHVNLGNALFKKGNVDEAFVHYQKALQINPDYAEAHVNLGNALLLRGNVDEAIVHYQKALHIEPDYATAHDNLGYALLQKGNVDEAIDHFQKALRINPEYAKAHNSLGNALLQKGNVDEAIVHYQKALHIEPDYATAHDNLGNALLQKGNMDEAIVHYKMALQINPDDAGAHNNLGNALFQKGNVDEAIAHFQKALQINPDYAKAHVNLGNALLQKGSVDEAIIQYQKALQINPENVVVYVSLGYALLQKGNVDEAITQYQKALQINPNYAKAHVNLGNALLQKGSVDEAIVHFQKALQINPDNAVVYVNLGYALIQKGNVDEAIVHYQKALQINPDYAKAHYDLGAALLQKGSVDEAIAQYQKALQINPDYAEAQNNLARVLATCPQASLRNGAKAVELARRANQLTGGGNPTVLDTLAAAYAEAGRFPEAVETAQRALRLAETQSNAALADTLRSQLKLYQADRPFHLH